MTHKIMDYPLSVLQEKLVLIQLSNPTNISYNVNVLLELDSHFYHFDQIADAVKSLAQSNPIVSAKIFEKNQQYFIQKAAYTINATLEMCAFEEEDFFAYLKKIGNQPFDILNEPLLRIKSFLNDSKLYVLLSGHHILFDFKSFEFLVHDLFLCMNNKAAVDASSRRDLTDIILSLPPIQHPFAQIQNLMDKNGLNEALFSKSDLLNLDENTVSEVEKWCKQNKMTLPLFFLMIWGTLIRRFLGVATLPIQIPFDYRSTHPLYQDLIGCAIEMHPIYFEHEKGNYWSDLKNHIVPQYLNILEKMSGTFIEDKPVAEASNQCGFNYMGDKHATNFPVFLLEKCVVELQSGTVGQVFIHGLKQQQGQFPYQLNAIKLKGAFVLQFKFNLPAEDLAHVKILPELFKKLMFAILNGAVGSLNQLSLIEDNQDAYYRWMTVDQQSRRIMKWSVGTKNKIEKNVLQLFADQVNRAPNATGIETESERYSYSDINLESDQFAHYLKLKGMVRGDIVGLFFDREPKLIIAILGVLKAGAVYLPISKKDPQHRIDIILKKSACKYVIFDSALVFFERYSFKRFGFSDFVQSKHMLPTDPFPIDESPQFSYLLFTSGSTGIPKGALNTHLGTANRLIWMKNFLNITPNSVILHKTPYTFDVSVWEYLLPLISGAKLILAKEDGHLDFDYLRHLIQQYQITTLHFVPSVLQEFIRAVNIHQLGSLQHIISSGETLSIELAGKLENSHITLYNLYGPTEASIDVSFWSSKYPLPVLSKSIPIGKPIDNVSLFILNGEKLALINEPGELYIGGIALGAGYINEEVLTKQRFIDLNLPDWQGRLYKTGDLCKWLPNGALEFLGRIDRQFKYNGQLVSPEEIERYILNIQGIAAVVVSLVNSSQNGFQHIVAHLVAKNEKDFDLGQLRRDLAHQFPSHMIPSQFYFLEAIPKLPNGKIDYASLIAIEHQQVLAGQKSSDDKSLLEKIKHIWELVFNFSINEDDDFFALGGTSLIALRIIVQIKKHFNFSCSYKDFLQMPTVRALYERVKVNKGVLAETGKNSDTIAWSPTVIQKSIWSIYQNRDAQKAYHIGVCFKMTGGLDSRALREAIARLSEMHELLLSNFFVEDGHLIAKKVLASPDLNVIKIAGNTRQFKTEFHEQYMHFVNKPFELGKEALLFRCQLVVSDFDESFLCVAFHHILVDDISINIWLQQLGQFYQEIKGDRPFSCERVNFFQEVHEAAVNSHKEDQLDQKFWLNILQEYPVVTCPKVKNNASFDYTGAVRRLKFSTELTAQIKNVLKKLRVTPSVYFGALFSYLVFRYVHEEKFLIGLPCSKKERYSVREGVIGPLFNVLPFPVEINLNWSLKEFVLAFHSRMLEALNHELEYSDIFALKKNHQPDFMPRIFFNWQGDQLEGADFGNGINFEALDDMDCRVSKYDLTLYGTSKQDHFTFSLEYAASYYDEDFSCHFMRHFETLTTNAIEDLDGKIRDLEIHSQNVQKTVPIQQKNILISLGEVVESNPEHICLVEDDLASINLKSFWAAINLAAVTLNLKGVRKGNRVMIISDKSILQVILMFAVMRVGAVYVPVDAALPLERVKTIIQNAEPQLVILAEDHLIEKFSMIPGVFYWDLQEVKVNHYQELLGLDEINRGDPAYLIYTSGSTGVPKGVLVSHGALSNAIQSFIKILQPKKGDIWLSVANIGFDIVLLDFLVCILSIGTLNLLKATDRYHPHKIIPLLDNKAVTVMQATPSLWKILIDSGWTGSNRLKILSGGEPLSSVLALQLLERGFELWNLYGPTEAAIYVGMEKIEDATQEVGLGRPVDHVRFYILDQLGLPVPIGGIGELFIAGESLAIEYYNDPVQTKKAFVTCMGERCYATGDLVRCISAEKLCFIERRDSQIKLRGHRVELKEVEHAISSACQFNDVVVLFFKERDTLICFYKVLPGDHFPLLSSEDIVERLSHILPSYMIPTQFIPLKAIPLTQNGKIDRDQLKSFLNQAVSGEKKVFEGHNQLKDKIVRIWCSVLKLKKINGDENFFDLGGDSFKAALLLQELSKEYTGIRVDISTVFIYPTVNKLLSYLTESMPSQNSEKSFAIEEKGTEIAVVGAAFEFPGFDSFDSLWELLKAKKNAIKKFSLKELKDLGVPEAIYSKKNYVPYCGFLEDFSNFDYEFFDLSREEASALDPQQRIMLMLAWKAMEDAEMLSSSHSDKKTGVFIAAVDNGYLSDRIAHKPIFQDLTSFQMEQINSDTDYLATKLAYRFDFKGPAITINTACSSGLTVMIEAIKSLEAGECDIALVGAVNLQIPPRLGYLYQDGFIFSPNGKCMPFSTEANGTVPSSGAGFIVLQKIEVNAKNNEHCYAMISGYGLNNDGRDKVGYLAPSMSGQVACMEQALKRAQISSEQVRYIEAHGTGTVIGDAVEMAALSHVYGGDNVKYFGSIKANVGHTGSASGLAGVLKAICMLQRDGVPPQAHFSEFANEVLKNNSEYLLINKELLEYRFSDRDYIAVNSLGIGGTNTHLIIRKVDGHPGLRLQRPLLHEFVKEKLWSMPEKSDQLKTEPILKTIDVEAVLNIIQGIGADYLIDPAKSFEENGFDSIHLISLRSALEEYFQIPLSDLKLLPHVLIAEFIESLVFQFRCPEPELLLLSEGKVKSDCTLVFIHPGNGSIDCYNQLLKYANIDLPVYAVSNPISIYEESFKSITIMAARYLDLLRDSVGLHNLIMIGWSFGGTLAYEMAVQLYRESGLNTPVMMFDSWAKIGSEWADKATFVNFYASKFVHEPNPLWLEKLWKRACLMLLNDKQAKSNIPIVLLKAKEVLDEYKSFEHPSNYWGSYTSQLKVVSCPLDHDSFFLEENLQDIARKFSMEFERLVKRK